MAQLGKYEASGFIFETTPEPATGDIELTVRFAYQMKMKISREMGMYTDFMENASQEMVKALVDYAVKDLIRQGKVKDVSAIES